MIGIVRLEWMSPIRYNLWFFFDRTFVLHSIYKNYIVEHYLDLQSSLSGLLISNLPASSNSLLALPASSGSSFKKLHANLSFQPFSFQALMLWFGNSSLISNIAISCAIKTNIFSSPSNSERLATLSCARGGSTYHPPSACGKL